MGDVVEESDGDLMGDGVKVAARIEGVCEPGGVCLSEDAHESQSLRSPRPIRASVALDPTNADALAGAAFVDSSDYVLGLSEQSVDMYARAMQQASLATRAADYNSDQGT